MTGTTKQTARNREFAKELRAQGKTLQQIGEALGFTREYARQLLIGTEFEKTPEQRAMEVADRRAKRLEEKIARAEAKKVRADELCKTCAGPLRHPKWSGHAHGECNTCRQYRARFGRVRPVEKIVIRRTETQAQS